MPSVQLKSIPRDAPIVLVVSDGGCSGRYATLPVGGNLFVLPNKTMLPCLDLPIANDLEFEIIGLRFTWGTQDVYVATLFGVNHRSKNNILWKSYVGDHLGLDIESKFLMRALHASFYCKDGFISRRTCPPNDQCQWQR